MEPHGDSAAPGDGGELGDPRSLSRLADVLSNPRQRLTVRTICRLQTEQLSLAELEREICRIADESATPERDAFDETSSLTRQSRLHHVVLPKLDDAGVITYDAAAKLVSVEHTEAATRLLEQFDALAR